MPEREIEAWQAKTLLETYATPWAACPIEALKSSGTDNALFRLGGESVLRVPKRASAAGLIEKELTWLPKLQGLPLSVPKVLFHGNTKQEIGYDFGIYKWEEGRIATPGHLADTRQAASKLAHFLTHLHQIDTDRAPTAGDDNHNRGVDLVALSENVATSIDSLADEIDVSAAHKMWERSTSVPGVSKKVWIHGDLKADNMIANRGELSAVIDWGLAAVGDPAADYAVAWTWVLPEDLEFFQDQCNISEEDWARAKGWALHCAVIALSYYRGRSHQLLCDQCRLTLNRLGLAR